MQPNRFHVRDLPEMTMSIAVIFSTVLLCSQLFLLYFETNSNPSSSKCIITYKNDVLLTGGGRTGELTSLLRCSGEGRRLIGKFREAVIQ
jgi:hypothetical protein